MSLEKNGCGRRIGALQSFWSLKKCNRTSAFRLNDLFPDFVGQLFDATAPREKKKKKIHTHR